MANQHADAPATIRVVELVGVSDKSWSDAAQQAVSRASETLRNITGVDVLHSTGIRARRAHRGIPRGPEDCVRRGPPGRSVQIDREARDEVLAQEMP
jgi:flavin-binding protein dodecin